jgi:hypothetical protein
MLTAGGITLLEVALFKDQAGAGAALGDLKGHAYFLS